MHFSYAFLIYFFSICSYNFKNYLLLTCELACVIFRVGMKCLHVFLVYLAPKDKTAWSQICLHMKYISTCLYIFPTAIHEVEMWCHATNYWAEKIKMINFMRRIIVLKKNKNAILYCTVLSP